MWHNSGGTWWECSCKASYIFISLTDFQNANPFPENNTGYLMTPCFSSGRPSVNDKFQTYMFIY